MILSATCQASPRSLEWVAIDPGPAALPEPKPFGFHQASRPRTQAPAKRPRWGLEGDRGQSLVREYKTLVLQDGALVIPQMGDDFR